MKRAFLLSVLGLAILAAGLCAGCGRKESAPPAGGASAITAENAEAELNRLEKEIQADK
jgi:hypothetical protein